MWNEGGAAPATLPATLPAAAPVLTAPGAEAQQVMARSPSHESFGTDLSLLSLSSLGSELGRLRGAHRASRCLLRVPSECFGTRRPISGEVLFEEESEVIRSCGALSSVLGLMKSFSTGDIGQAIEENQLRASVSEVALCADPRGRLDYTSRSCSTWVAVGDVSSTSQLPSPQALPAADSPGFTAADFVRSVNKRVRQMYIRRRLMSTYKALERLTKSELNLSAPPKDDLPQVQVTTELNRNIRDELDLSSLGFRGANRTLSLTVKDVERDRGKPLTKYERNMMIFNWLQSLDENTFEQS